MAAQPMPEAISPKLNQFSSAVPIRMSLEEYLHTAFHPDREYVGGQAEEKTMGGMEHGYLQAELSYWFRQHREDWGIRVASEVRTQVSPDQLRLPDIIVLREKNSSAERVLSAPPLIAIEILSPDDRFHRVIPRLEDLTRMGTEHVWLLDPAERVAYRYADGGLKLVQEARLTLPDSPIYLDLPELFAAALD